MVVVLSSKSENYRRAKNGDYRTNTNIDLSKDPLVEYEIHECTGGSVPIEAKIPVHTEENIWTICLGKDDYQRYSSREYSVINLQQSSIRFTQAVLYKCSDRYLYCC